MRKLMSVIMMMLLIIIIHGMGNMVSACVEDTKTVDNISIVKEDKYLFYDAGSLLITLIDSQGENIGEKELFFDRFVSTKTLLISKEVAKIQLEKKSGYEVNLDEFILDGNIPKEQWQKLKAKDNDLLEIKKPVIFDVKGKGKLIISARAPKKLDGVSIRIPHVNQKKGMNIDSTFLNYKVGDNEHTYTTSDKVPQDKIFYQEIPKLTSGHPRAPLTYRVANDNEYLYVFTEAFCDNTFDHGKDYSTVYIKTDNSLKAYSVRTVEENEYGEWSFEYTKSNKDFLWQHMLYLIKIPLKDLHVEKGNNIELAFEYYGTASGTPYGYIPAGVIKCWGKKPQLGEHGDDLSDKESALDEQHPGEIAFEWQKKKKSEKEFISTNKFITLTGKEIKPEEQDIEGQILAGQIVELEEGHEGNLFWYKSFYLPIKDKEDNDVEYMVKESEVEGWMSEIEVEKEEYEGQVMGILYYIINRPIINIPVEKVWSGKEGNSAKVHLYKTINEDNNAIEEVDSVVLNAGNQWKHTFKDLRKYTDDNKKIRYIVKEDEILGYETEITGDQEKGFTITNRYVNPNPSNPGTPGNPNPSNPGTPGNPNPSNPGTPGNPNPGTPGTPGNPNPENPGNPNPENLGNSRNPNHGNQKYENPKNKNQKSKDSIRKIEGKTLKKSEKPRNSFLNKNVPKTGDRQVPLLYTIVIGISVLGLFLLGKRKGKIRKENF